MYRICYVVSIVHPLGTVCVNIIPSPVCIYLWSGASIIYNTTTGRYHFSERNDPIGHTPTEGDKDSAIPASFSDYHRGYSLVRGRIFSNNPNDDEGDCPLCVYWK